MIAEEQLREVLVKQRETILTKPPGVERTVLQKIGAKLKLPHAIVITGLRRSGKSTLFRQIIQKWYDDRDFYYITFEDERLFNFPADEFSRIHENLISLFGEKKTFFFDEIQNVSNFETFVRRLYDQGCKLFITGSSAKLLSKELATKLTGRHMDIEVTPFSFAEFLKLRGMEIGKDGFYKAEIKARVRNYFDEYLEKGGMPEYAVYGDPEILARVYEDIVLKDIAVRHSISNVAVLRELFQYLITNVANKFSYHALKKLMQVGSVNTIKKYISFLEETYFAATINKFDYALKKQIMNDKKPYIVDNGFISLLSRKATKDKGWLLENAVFNAFGPEQQVFYSAGKKECDFILVRGKEVSQAVQVCFELDEQNKERELAGLKEAMETFRLKRGLLLTNSQEYESAIEGKKITVKPVWKWLLEKDGA